MEWRSRIVGHGAEAPEQLLANPKNWRIHPKEQQDALSSALDQVGWVKPIVVNQTSGCVVDGHLRVGLAISKGETEVPVSYVDLDEDEERAVLATLDPLAGLAEADQEAYEELVAGIGNGAEGPDPTSPEDPAEGLLRTLSKQLDDGGTAIPRPVDPGGPVEAICPGCGHEWEVEVPDAGHE